MIKFLIFIVAILQISNTYAEILTCKKISEAVIKLPALDVRPYCDTAEIRCHGLQKLNHTKMDSLLAESLVPKLQAQVQFELELCEMAIRAADPNYLKPRTPSDI